MKKGTKKKYLCLGGPLHHHTLALHTPHTMVFSIGKEKGRYRPALEVLTVLRANGREHEITREVYRPLKHGHTILDSVITFSDKVTGSKFIHWEAA